MDKSSMKGAVSAWKWILSRAMVGALILAGCAEFHSDADLPDLLRELPEWELSPEPIYTLGGHAASPNEVFRFPASIQWLESGLLLVADQGPRQIRLFDDGAHLRSLGRQGEGPGEYRSLRSVDRLGGTPSWSSKGLERLSKCPLLT